jgi:hypothetical protein
MNIEIQKVNMRPVIKKMIDLFIERETFQIGNAILETKKICRDPNITLRDNGREYNIMLNEAEQAYTKKFHLEHDIRVIDEYLSRGDVTWNHEGYIIESPCNT